LDSPLVSAPRAELKVALTLRAVSHLLIWLYITSWRT
jgi:hypothetical protein